MKDYSRDNVNTIALISPHGTGKTTLAEGMMFLSGTTDKLGKVDDGSSTLDFELEEKSRKMSINSHVSFAEWNGNIINVVDTPGFSNFLFEAESSLKVVDSAILVLNSYSSIKSQAKRFRSMIDEMKLPSMIFINKLDKEIDNYENNLKEIQNDYKARIAPLNIPIKEGDELRGIYDLVEQKYFVFSKDGQQNENPLDDNYGDYVKKHRELLIESVAELDDELLERYLEGETIDNNTIIENLKLGITNCNIVPILCGSAIELIGVSALLDGIVKYCPSAAGSKPVKGLDENGEEIVREPGLQQPPTAYIFKTISDPYAGKITIFKVFSGEIKPDSTIFNSSKDSKEKLTHLYRLIGKKQIPVENALHGDIVAVNKLKDAQTGDTLTVESEKIIIKPTMIPQAVMSYAIEPISRSDEDKLMPSLNRIQEEDPVIQYKVVDETKEFLLSGAGQVHVEVIVERLKSKYGVEVKLKTPRVPYKETIRSRSKAEGKYIKQTGGRGQYGDAWLELIPLQRGSGYEFVNNIVGGVIPRNFIPSVEKGVIEAMKKGISSGYPVVDVKVRLFDGKHHPVDSSDIAFQIAGSMAFKKAMENAKPQLLEPIMSMKISAPEDCMGDIIGDVNSRRGKVSGVDSFAGENVINALIPMSEVLKYAPELRSITSGRGTFKMDFSHYEEVPNHLAAKIVEESSKDIESEH